MAEVKYCIEYAKTGRSGCKKCKQQIEKGVARIGKVAPNPFSDDGGDMKVWYHVKCMFETFKVPLLRCIAFNTTIQITCRLLGAIRTRPLIYANILH